MLFELVSDDRTEAMMQAALEEDDFYAYSGVRQRPPAYLIMMLH